METRKARIRRIDLSSGRALLKPNCDCVVPLGIDGMLCGLLMSYYFGWRVTGFSDGRIAAIRRDASLDDCAWLNSKMLLMVLDGKRTFKRKYPLGTIHLLLGIVGSARKVDIRNEAICPLLYTDGTFKNMFNFPENTLDWLAFMCADNDRSPLYKVFFNNSYTTSDLMKALKDFFAKIKDISGGTKGGEKIVISNGKGEPVNFRSCAGGLFALDDAQVAVANGFLSMLADLTGWKHDPSAWAFSGLRIFRFEKGAIKPNGRNFDALMAKNPLSWAMTNGQAIEYTIERDAFR